MNLIQQAEQLKNLPDQALAQMQQRPTDMPPYLVVAEMQRRSNMRKAYQGQQGSPMNQPPVVQQMAQQFAQQSQQQPQGPPMQMAGGGLVKGYWGGGPVKEPPSGLAGLAEYFDQMQGMMPVPQMSVDPGGGPFPGYSTMNDSRYNRQRDLMAPVPDVQDHAYYVAERKKTSGESPLKAIADKLGIEESEMRGKKPKLSQILMQLGLGMAASRRPDFAGAIGEGGIGALQGYTHERDRTRALADRIAEKRLRAIEGAQRHNDRIEDYATEARRGDIAARNMAMQGNNNIELGIMRQAAAEGHDISMADRQQTALQAAAALAAQKEEALEGRRREEAATKFGYDKELVNMRNQGKASKGKDKDGAPSPLQTVAMLNGLADDLSRSADFLERQAAAIEVTGNNPKDPLAIRRLELQQQAEGLRQKANAARQRHQDLVDKLTGAAPAKPQSDLGTGSLFAPIPDYRKPGAGRPAPLFIPPPPRR